MFAEFWVLVHAEARNTRFVWMWTRRLHFDKFKSGGMHEKHSVATWTVAPSRHLSVRQRQREDRCGDGRSVAGPSERSLQTLPPVTCAVALLTFWIACYVQLDDCSHTTQQHIYCVFHWVVVWPVVSAPCGHSNWSSVGISFMLTTDWILWKVFSSSSSSRSVQVLLSLMSWIRFLGFSFLKSFVTSYRHLFFGRPLVGIPLGFQSWS
jgi:hypothetical protein